MLDDFVHSSGGKPCDQLSTENNPDSLILLDVNIFTPHHHTPTVNLESNDAVAIGVTVQPAGNSIASGCDAVQAG
jgi:hypothetical protein